VSLRTCDHLGQVLAANATCGARCSRFPACLPPLPPELPGQVADLCDPAEEEAVVSVGRVLGRLHAAIVDGLARKG
jgi:hypothetical protein